MVTFGKAEKSNKDSFNAHLTDKEPLIEAERQALLDYKKHPNTQTMLALR